MGAYQVKRTDKNQQDIMDTLRSAGYAVHDTHELGGGFPDILVACERGNVLVEVKMPGKDLNAAERKFHAHWPGPLCVIYYKDEAAEMIEQAIGGKE